MSLPSSQTKFASKFAKKSLYMPIFSSQVSILSFSGLVKLYNKIYLKKILKKDFLRKLLNCFSIRLIFESRVPMGFRWRKSIPFFNFVFKWLESQSILKFIDFYNSGMSYIFFFIICGVVIFLFGKFSVLLVMLDTLKVVIFTSVTF